MLSPESLLYCLLDPWFKTLSFSPKEPAESARQLLADLHSKFHEKPVLVNELDDNQHKLQDLYGVHVEPMGTARTVLDSYYREALVGPLENPLHWWRMMKEKYPALAKIARKLLARPSTSVPCEQLWSEAGNISNDLRSSLDADSVAMLTFIEHNVRELKKVNRPFTWS